MTLTERLLDKYGETMSPAQVAALLGYSVIHARKLCVLGILPAVKIGDRWQILTAELAAKLEGR